MEIKFYHNKSDNRTIRKELSGENTIIGTLRESCNIIEPVITIESRTPLRYNYAYIPDFQRYYFVNKITSLRIGLWLLELEVDPLMSFKGDILNLKVVVDKQSEKVNGDEYIDDGSLVADNYMIKHVYNFSKGFNNSSEYILITAG